MSEQQQRDELAEIIQDCGEYIPGSHADDYVSPDKAADHILAAGYRKPRVIKSAAALEALTFGSAVQTSDDSDVVVLRSEGRSFRNQSGAELSVEDLWRYGTQPFTVIFEAEVTK